MTDFSTTTPFVELDSAYPRPVTSGLGQAGWMHQATANFDQIISGILGEAGNFAQNDFTPEFANVQTDVQQKGGYVQVGRLCTVWARFWLHEGGSLTGNVSLPLPVPAAFSEMLPAVVTGMAITNNGAKYMPLSGWIENDVAVIITDGAFLGPATGNWGRAGNQDRCFVAVRYRCENWDLECEA